MTHTTETKPWKAINFRTIDTLIQNAYKSGYEINSTPGLIELVQPYVNLDVKAMMQAYNLGNQDWGIIKGEAGIVGFAQPSEGAGSHQENIQNALTTFVLRKRVEDQQPKPDQLSIAYVAAMNRQLRILAASYQVDTGALYRVNISTGQDITHQSIKQAPTQPGSFDRSAGFITPGMAAQTGHNRLADILYDPDGIGVGMVGDLHDSVAQQLEMQIKSDTYGLGITLEGDDFSFPLRF